MKRLKTFAKYILLIVLFYFFSNILIFIGLNTTYDNIYPKTSIPEGVVISSAKATLVNGEVKGNISSKLDSKYVKFDFYTDIDSLAGSFYLSESELENGNFEFYFKLQNIESYSVEITDEKPDTLNLEDFSLEQFKGHVILSLLFVAMFI